MVRFRSSGKPTLLQNQRYTKARVELRPGSSVRVYLNLAHLRKAQRRSFFKRLPGAARLLAGPVAHRLDTATRLDGRLDVLPGGIDLTGRVDGSSAASDDHPAASLLRHGAKKRQLPPQPEGTIAVLSLDRDLRAFFNNVDRLLGEDAATGAKTFLSTANQFLGNLDFADGLLPALDLPGAFFVTDTEPEVPEDQPRIKLPAFTLAVPLAAANEKKVKQALTRAMQTIGFVATTQRRRSNREPVQLSARNEKRGKFRYQYLAYGDWEGPGLPPTDLNFGVTLLFAHGHLIVSSTRDGAVRAGTAIQAGGGKMVRGDYLIVKGAELAKYATKNLAPLALDRVLKEGETMPQANRFWRGAAGVLKILEAEISVVPGQQDTTLTVNLRRQRR